MRNLLLITAAALLVGCSDGDSAPIESHVVVNSVAPEMVSADTAARKSLGAFMTQVPNPPSDWSHISVKVGFPTRDDSVEHIWVNEITIDGDSYSGVLGNHPVNVEGLQHGDRVDFAYADIGDWQYMKNGKLYGHYTTRAMLHTLSPEQRLQMQSLLSENPE